MKTSFLFGLLFVSAIGARAQQSPSVAPSQPVPTQQQPAATPAATDEWGTPTTPTAMPASDATAPDAAATDAQPSAIDAALGTNNTTTPGSPNGAVKPLNPQPKLNPNSSGTYDKKLVKTQNKRSSKVIAKRRRATARYADVRRGDTIHGIRQMERGKVATISSKR